MTHIRRTAATAAAVTAVLLLFCLPAVPALCQDAEARQSDTLEISPNALRAASARILSVPVIR